MKIIDMELLNKLKDILVIKPLNFFIGNMKLNDEILDILIQSYYNMIKVNKTKLIEEWEIWCSKDLFEKLKTIVDKNDNSINAEQICKKKIKQIIVKGERLLPRLPNINIVIDNGVLMNNCYYTGLYIDILYGLILLNNSFQDKGLSCV
jgi:hypothetical protein